MVTGVGYRGVREPQQAARQVGSEDHAERNRLTVTQLIVLPGLDGVPQSMAVVQQFAADPRPHRGGLAQVGGDHIRLELHRPADEFGVPGAADIASVRRVLPDQLQDAAVPNEPGLDHLCQPGTHFAVRQGAQQVKVGQYRLRLVKGAYEVLALRQVDTGLAAHRGVHHCQHGGGDAEVRHAAQPAGRHETGQIGGRSPTDTDDQVGASETCFGQRPPALDQYLGRLRGLAGRHPDAEHRDLLGADQLGNRQGGLGQGFAVDHCDPGGLTDQAGQSAERPVVDLDRVGAFGVHADGTHFTS